MGVLGLMKASIGKPLFSGDFDEYLESTLVVYDTLGTMCEVTDQEKRQEMPTILQGDAIKFFSEKPTNCLTYEEGSNLVRDWYVSPKKRN